MSRNKISRSAAPEVPAAWFGEAPVEGEGVGGFFFVGDFAPAAVAEEGVGEFVGDHIAGKIGRSLLKSGAQHDAAAFFADRAGNGEMDFPAFAGDVVFQRDAEAGIVDEIPLNFVRELIKHRHHLLAQAQVVLKIGQKSLNNRSGSPRDAVVSAWFIFSRRRLAFKGDGRSAASEPLFIAIARATNIG